MDLLESKDKILIVDDSKLSVRILSDILKNMGYDVVSAYSAKEALSMATSERPSLILLDIVLPDMDGIEVVSLVSKRENTKDIPVIMVTSLEQPEYLKAALDAGAMDYVRKPFSEVELTARVNSALRQKELYDKLKKMAVTDSLTSLYNHAYLVSKLERRVKESKRYDNPVSFIMMDIDHFKNVNDTYGHSAGDCVLVGVSDVIKSLVRDVDIVSRYGGEEFSVVLPFISLDKTCIVAERIRKNIEIHEFVCGDYSGNISITISIGVSSYPDVGIKGHKDLIIMADKALYEAKSSGRNRTIYFKDGNFYEVNT